MTRATTIPLFTINVVWKPKPPFWPRKFFEVAESWKLRRTREATQLGDQGFHYWNISWYILLLSSFIRWKWVVVRASKVGPRKRIFACKIDRYFSCPLIVYLVSFFSFVDSTNFLTRSRAFQTLVNKAFAICDSDGVGEVSKSELYAGLLLVHCKWYILRKIRQDTALF